MVAMIIVAASVMSRLLRLRRSRMHHAISELVGMRCAAARPPPHILQQSLLEQASSRRTLKGQVAVRGHRFAVVRLLLLLLMMELVQLGTVLDFLYHCHFKRLIYYVGVGWHLFVWGEEAHWVEGGRAPVRYSLRVERLLAFWCLVKATILQSMVLLLCAVHL